MRVKVGALVGQVQKHVCLGCRVFAADAWQANVQAVACSDALHTSTLPLARLPCSSMRCFASGASEASAEQAPDEEKMEAGTEHKVVGSYTSHTKRLWLERLLREKRGDAGSRLPEPREKAPVLTTVSYPFSTDPVLQEEVRSKRPDLPECACLCAQFCKETGCALPVFRSHVQGLWESRTRQGRRARVLADWVRAGAAQYRNPWDFMRMGKLLEDLDSLAGSVAFRHWCGGRPCCRDRVHRGQAGP